MSELFTQKVSGTNTTNTYFYAVFTTSQYAVSASAICKFSLDQLLASFHADYSNTNGQPLSEIPHPRPSSCPAKLTYQHLIFSRKNTMMANDVQSEALVVETARTSRFTSIDVDFNSNDNRDMIYIGTDSGQVLTFVIKNDQLIYSEQLQLNIKTSILNIQLNEIVDSRSLILMTQNKLISVPAAYCNSKYDQASCKKHPYCTWSLEGLKCHDSKTVYISPTFKTSTQPTTTSNTPTLNIAINTTVTYSSSPVKTFLNNNLDTLQNKNYKFNMNLFTFTLIIIFFVSGSFVLGVAVSALLLGVKSDTIMHRIKSFKVSKMKPSGHIVVEKEKEIDQFESLYSQVIPKKREPVSNIIRQQQGDYSEPVVGGSYLANIDLPLNSQFFVNNSRFFDYDESEYFTIKNSRYRQNGNRTSSTSASSASSDSSDRTLNSQALLVSNQQTVNRKSSYDQTEYSAAGGRINNRGKFYI